MTGRNPLSPLPLGVWGVFVWMALKAVGLFNDWRHHHRKLEELSRLRAVKTGYGHHGLTLDTQSIEELREPIDLPAADVKAGDDVFLEDPASLQAYKHSAVHACNVISRRYTKTQNLRRVLRARKADLQRAERYRRKNSHSSFQRFRSEFLFSAAGILRAAAITGVVGLIGCMGYTDFGIATRIVRLSPLFDQPNGLDPDAPMVDPPASFVASFCFVPVCMFALALKILHHPPTASVNRQAFKRLSLVTMALSLVATIGFAWIVGGHESLIWQLIQGEGKKTIAGISVASRTPPFEYAAIMMILLGYGATALAGYLPGLLKPFFETRRAVDNPHNQRLGLSIERANLITSDALEIVDEARLQLKSQCEQFGFLIDQVVGERNLSELESIRKRLKKMMEAGLVFLLMLSGGCNSDSAMPPLEIAADTVVSTEVRQTVEAHVIISDAMPTESVRSPLYQWLTQDLPKGSLVHLYEGERHRYVTSINVPGGSPEARVQNERFQQSFIAVEEFFNERRPHGSDQVNWPSVAETIQARGNQKKDVVWVVLCGNPLFVSEEYPVYSFVENRYASHGLIGRANTPFLTDIKLPPGALVSWLSSNAIYGESRVQRSENACFQSVYWQELGGQLINISPDPGKAFGFSPPFSIAANPERRNEIPMMVDATVPSQFQDGFQEPKPVEVKRGYRRSSSAKPGSLRYRIEMAGGNIDELRGESLVLQIYFDSSGSMASRIEETVQTVMRLANELPPFVRSLEVGCIAANSKTVETFPIQTIRARSADGGKSINELGQFLGSIKADFNDFPTLAAIMDGVQTLNESGAGKRKFFLFLSDIVALESGNPQAEMDRVIHGIKKWTSQPDSDNRVIALFSGTAEHANFIRRVATSHVNGTFSNDPDVLAEQVIMAAVPSVDQDYFLQTKEVRHEN